MPLLFLAETPTLTPATRPQLCRDRVFDPMCPEATNVYVETWNALVVVDRRCSLGDQAQTLQALNRIIGRAWRSSKWSPLVKQAIRDYRDTRGAHPHRMKSAEHLSLPLVGPLTQLGQGLVQGRLLVRQGVFFLRGLRDIEATAGRPTERLSRVYHCSDVEDIGLSATPDGLDIVAINHRAADKGKTTLYHADLKQLVRPGFIQDLYRHIIAPKANTVALDVSMLPIMSGPMKHVVRRLHRLLRARKAESAIEYRKVSPWGEEIQDVLKLAVASRLNPSTVRFLKREAVLKCPHCGAPVAVRLDEKTSAPAHVKRHGAQCGQCRGTFLLGHLLAARASAQVHYAFFEHVVRGEERPTLD